MTWVKLDDGFPDHPKVAAAGPHGLVAQVRSLCYAARHLTDGFLPDAIARRLTADLDHGVIDVMCERGLWERRDGGFVIHDYLDYQPSGRHVLQVRKKRARYGRAGGLAKALANEEAKSCPVPVPVPVPVPEPRNSVGRSTRRRAPVEPPPSLEILIAEFAASEAYAGIDVRASALRCEQWCRVKRKRLSRMRLVNWLNGDAADRVNGGLTMPSPRKTAVAALNDAWKNQPVGDVKL